MSFKVKAEAMRLKETVVAEDREAFAVLVGSIGQIEADSIALEKLVTALAPRFHDLDLRGLKNREAAELIGASLERDAAVAHMKAATGKTSTTTRPGDDV